MKSKIRIGFGSLSLADRIAIRRRSAEGEGWGEGVEMKPMDFGPLTLSLSPDDPKRIASLLAGGEGTKPVTEDAAVHHRRS